MYSEKVMDHFNNPRNVGEIENPSGVGTVGNAKCGDIMRMYLDIDDNGIIQEAKFKTFGCGAAVATSSMATELVKGKTIQEALQVTNKAVMEALDGLPPVKVHCSLLAEEAIHAALWDYAEKHNIKIEGLERPDNVFVYAISGIVYIQHLCAHTLTDTVVINFFVFFQFCIDLFVRHAAAERYRITGFAYKCFLMTIEDRQLSFVL